MRNYGVLYPKQLTYLGLEELKCQNCDKILLPVIGLWLRRSEPSDLRILLKRVILMTTPKTTVRFVLALRNTDKTNVCAR
ncbi:MAG: hypothetical protein BWY68_00709 [bacterium ADurb.Bin400]|nr:MAG: hypothetical protein BWY68_00709 [bacterium ADurb.Bin400]